MSSDSSSTERRELRNQSQNDETFIYFISNGIPRDDSFADGSWRKHPPLCVPARFSFVPRNGGTHFVAVASVLCCLLCGWGAAGFLSTSGWQILTGPSRERIGSMRKESVQQFALR